MSREEFVELINKHLKNSIGRYNSLKLNEKWFTKNNLLFLYEEILEKTESIRERSISERIWAYENLPIPKCIECDNPAKRYDNARYWSSYCSDSCAKKSKTRAEKISKSHKSRDHTESNKKREQTNTLKYGAPFNAQRDAVKTLLSLKTTKRFLSESVINLLNDRDWLHHQYVTEERTSVDIAKELGVDYSTVLLYCRKHEFEIRRHSNYSMHEIELCEYLQELGVEYQSNNRSILDPFELDVFIPSVNLALEINGLYWHSNIEPHKHYLKYIKCREKGIKLIQITDYEWIHKKDIVKSMVKNSLGLNEKIYARKCSINAVSKDDQITFINGNHIQGYTYAQECIGLYYNDELLSILSFSKPRFNDEYDLEIIRYCTKLNHTIVGGLSKLIKWLTENRTFDTIMTYVDLDKGNGNGFKQCGFEKIKHAGISYFWTDGDIIIPRYKTQKHKLFKFLGDKFDSKLSEKENMLNNNYRQYWTCGNNILVYSNNKKA